MTISRRQLLGAAGATGLAAAAGATRWWPEDAANAASSTSTRTGTTSVLPAPGKSGIEHVVVVMMENRSFDHFLGWLPGADGKQAGLTYKDRYGVRHQTHHLEAFDSCGFHDPDHSYEGGRIQLNGGKCNGFLRSGQNDLLAIGYYTDADLPFYAGAARDWTTFDRYFSAVMAETYPNRFYMHAAQTDRLHNNTSQCTLKTIWDRLAAKGVSGKYYYSDVPFTALWYGTHQDISFHFADFLTDAAAGTLPAVSFVDPRFQDEESGTSNDDHPHADVRAGQAFLNQVYDAVRNGPGWEKTVLVINYDEWGGFYDHVPPTTAPDVSPKTALRGFRVPALMISPLARRNYISHHVYDHTSVLKMIEWRWGLKPLTPRDANARNIAEVLDFTSPPNTASPTYTVPTVTPLGCATAPKEEGGAEFAEWGELKELALDQGWRLPN
ncbi:alkaline phosphatase family protein [Nocardioides sp. LS1]|uniref:alkaline phosphatase family protein n=1 Tax=Nocardioides sp. LS1 TaxID=1027620 RepID=UPI000FF99DF6|nr:alkaline phosphatase family protein [Nocardioides sp. LS1]GCD91863.1 phospholipase C 4 [Nocardioides sp. LS1]